MPKVRNSNLELFCIITMLLIVMHHYVVNSGLLPIIWENYPSAKSLFLLLFGWGGKTGIFLVSDSNKPLAVLTAVFAFIFFKNLEIGYSKIINTIAASAFGVLLIHANCNTMRQWLWRDSLDNVGHFADNIYLHAIVSVLAVYAICTLIDFIRIQLLEKPFFSWFDKFAESRRNKIQ